MSAEIYLFPDVRGTTIDQDDKPLPLYELYWKRKNGADEKPMCISSRDPDRIIRQMQSLAQRGICASVYADGWPCGGVGLAGGGQHQVSFFPRSRS